MATVTKTIGTSSRDYSTITAWEADLDTGSIYSSGDDAVGECYNDSAFDEDFIMNGGGTVGLNSVKLSVASGERHDGTEGSGARIVVSSSPTYAVIDLRVPAGFNQKYTIEWIELDVNGQSALPLTNDSSAYTNVGIVKNVIIHGANGGQAYNGFVKADSRSITLSNSIFYDHTRNSGSYCRGITVDMDQTEALIANCTIYGVSNPHTTAPAYGIIANGGDSGKIKNNIVMNITTGGSGAKPCFSGTALTGGKADYNMSDDDTADDLGGSNNLINKSNSTQFVSTVSGSEDLHIVSTSDAVGAGEDLATTSVDINGSDRNALAATVWDIGAHQYASTASIGTSSRDYSTITAWEADLDDTTIYGAGANAVGECYNDSTFTVNAQLNINGGGTVGLASITLQPASGQGHDGTADTGVKIASASVRVFVLNTFINQIEIDSTYDSFYPLLTTSGNSGSTPGLRATRMLLHGTGMANAGSAVGASAFTLEFLNSIVYSCDINGVTLYNSSFGRYSRAANTTIYNCTGYGLQGYDHSNINIHNIISVGNSGNDFETSYSNATISNNISSDGTASGSGSKTNQPASRQFVSTVGGSEDLHLIFKSAAIDAGVDLGTSPDGVQYDINGKNRDAEGSIWDIGAHEYGDNVIFGLLRV